jgi:hypothetical protein
MTPTPCSHIPVLMEFIFQLESINELVVIMLRIPGRGCYMIQKNPQSLSLDEVIKEESAIWLRSEGR